MLQDSFQVCKNPHAVYVFQNYLPDLIVIYFILFLESRFQNVHTVIAWRRRWSTSRDCPCVPRCIHAWQRSQSYGVSCSQANIYPIMLCSDYRWKYFFNSSRWRKRVVVTSGEGAHCKNSSVISRSYKTGALQFIA